MSYTWKSLQQKTEATWGLSELLTPGKKSHSHCLFLIKPGQCDASRCFHCKQGIFPSTAGPSKQRLYFVLHDVWLNCEDVSPLWSNLKAGLLGARWEDGELGDSLFEVWCFHRREACGFFRPILHAGRESKHGRGAEWGQNMHAPLHVCDSPLWWSARKLSKSHQCGIQNIWICRWGYIEMARGQHIHSGFKSSVQLNWISCITAHVVSSFTDPENDPRATWQAKQWHGKKNKILLGNKPWAKPGSNGTFLPKVSQAKLQCFTVKSWKHLSWTNPNILWFFLNNTPNPFVIALLLLQEFTIYLPPNAYRAPFLLVWDVSLLEVNGSY